MRCSLFLAAIVLVSSAGAFAGTPIAAPETFRAPNPRPSRPVVLTGTIFQLRVAISGDFSGWRLLKTERSFNLNVNAVLLRANELEGQRVVLHGLLTTGRYADGTPFQQVVVTSISPAP